MLLTQTNNFLSLFSMHFLLMFKNNSISLSIKFECFVYLNIFFILTVLNFHLQIILRKQRIEVRTNLLDTLTNTIIMSQLPQDYF